VSRHDETVVPDAVEVVNPTSVETSRCSVPMMAQLAAVAADELASMAAARATGKRSRRFLERGFIVDPRCSAAADGLS
jgi:hypothetical protein